MKHLLLALFTFVLPAAAHSAVLGSLVIDDRAFADDVAATSGTLRTYDAVVGIEDPVTPKAAISGSNVDQGIYCTAACTFDVLFADNLIVNGAGADLVLFEGGANESLSVTINSISRTLLFDMDIEEAGFVDGSGVQVGYWFLDLDDFGIAAGDSIFSVGIDLLYGDRGREGIFASADLVAVGALNSVDVPLPAGLPLAMAGIGCMALLRLRRRGPLS